MTKPRKVKTNKSNKPDSVSVQNDGDLYGAISNPIIVCTAIDHKKKKNCSTNPWCLFGLIDDKKKGIWKPKPTGLIELGNDPRLLSRRLQNNIILKPCGLQNLGATCYLNALIQMLFQNLLIRDAVFNMSDEIDYKAVGENYSNGSKVDMKDRSHIDMIVDALQDAFGHLDKCIKSTFDISLLVDLLGLKKDEQQDPEEFSNLFLAKLEECKLPLRNSSILNIKQLTTGKQKYLTICQECGRSSGQSNAFHELELNLGGCDDLKAAIEIYCSEETVDGENQVFNHIYEK